MQESAGGLSWLDWASNEAQKYGSAVMGALAAGMAHTVTKRAARYWKNPTIPMPIPMN